MLLFYINDYDGLEEEGEEEVELVEVELEDVEEEIDFVFDCVNDSGGVELIVFENSVCDGGEILFIELFILKGSLYYEYF